MRGRRITIAVIVVFLFGGFLYMNPLLPIITGYSAKNLSSGVFVAGRTQDSMEETDLNFSFIKYVNNKIDFQNGEVSSRFLWHKSKAIMTDGAGCTLVKKTKTEDILDNPFYQYKQTINTDTIAWPMGDLVADTVPSSVNMEKLNTALDMAFADTIPSKGTFAVVVVHKGQLVAERYKNGFTAKNKFLSWSMAKSFTNALTGIRVKQGMMDINKSVDLPEWQNDERKNITINNLLQMNSGLEWNEDYGNNSDVNIMLHKVGDMGQYAIDKPLEHKPGEVWYYSSGTTNIVCLLLRKSFNNDEAYYEFPRKELFNKIGMHSAVFETDASGTFIGSSYLYASMRDFARFGLLYLNNGIWCGEQILPKGWVDYSHSESNGSEGQYGAFFWLNKSGKLPDVPRDMYSCNGHDGQFIFIIPSKELVVVRTGFSKKGEFDRNKFLANIVNSIEHN